VEAWFRRKVWILGVTLAVALAITHMFWSSDVRIDGVTIALLAVVLLSPYLSLMRRIRFGELEAEIAPEEVEEVRQRVQEASSTQSPQEKDEEAQPSSHSRHVEGVVDDLLHVLDRDPALALAKLRIEIERLLEQIYFLDASPEECARPPAGVMGFLRALSRKEIIDKPTLAAVGSMTRVLNRAVHGASFEREQASEIIDSGASLLDRLNDAYMEVYERAFRPVEEETIDMQQHDAAQSSRYRVVTITPLIPNPQRRTYIMTQGQLDSFLEGYDEYAEYLISIEPEGDSGEP
jgi:hypothetical protein